MDRLGMQSTRSSRSSNSGFTVIELLVSSSLGLFVTLLCARSVMTHRDVLFADAARTRVAQNLRGAMDVLISDGKEAGEQMIAAEPAIELTSGSGSNPDTLILRRNLLSTVLNLCTAVTAGSSPARLYFANSTTQAGCIYAAEGAKYTVWQSYRQANGNTVDAFLYNSNTRQGEFFKYTGEGSDGSQYWITRSGSAFANAYPAISSWIFIMEEWKYQLSGEMLQIVQNRNTAAPYNVSYAMTGFQTEILLKDGTRKTTFAATDDWTKIRRLEVTLAGTDKFKQQIFNQSITDFFFPRNILSN